MFNEFNNLKYKNDNVNNSQKELSKYRENISAKEQISIDDAKAKNYKEFGDHDIQNEVKTESTHVISNTSSVITKLASFISTASVVLVVAVVYGTDLLTGPKSIVKDMLLKFYEETLSVEVDFENYDEVDNLQLRITNDFTDRLIDIDELLVNEEGTYFFTDVGNLKDNVTYDVKVVSGADTVYSKEITVGVTKTLTKVEDVYLSKEMNNIYFDGRLIDYRAEEDIIIKLTSSSTYLKMPMEQCLEPKQEENMQMFFGMFENLSAGQYVFSIESKKDIIYRSEITISPPTLSSIEEISADASENIIYFSGSFSNYVQDEELIIYLTGDNYSSEKRVEECLETNHDQVDRTIFYGQFDNLEDGRYYFSIKSKYGDEIYYQEIEVVLTKTHSTIENFSTEAAIEAIYFYGSFSNYVEDEELFVHLVGDNFDEVVYISDLFNGTATPTTSSRFSGEFNNTMEGIYTITVESKYGDIIYQDTVVNEAMSSMIRDFSGIYDGTNLSITIDFTEYFAEDNLYIQSPVISDNEKIYLDGQVNSFFDEDNNENIYRYSQEFSVQEVESTDVKLFYKTDNYQEEITLRNLALIRTTIDSTNFDGLDTQMSFDINFSDYNDRDTIILKLTSDTDLREVDLKDYYDSYNASGTVTDLTTHATYNVQIVINNEIVYEEDVYIKRTPSSQMNELDIEAYNTNIKLDGFFEDYSIDDNVKLKITNIDDETESFEYELAEYIDEQTAYLSFEADDFILDHTYHIVIHSDGITIYETNATTEYRPFTSIDFMNVEGEESEINVSGQFETYSEDEELHLLINNVNDDNEQHDYLVSEFIILSEDSQNNPLYLLEFTDDVFVGNSIYKVKIVLNDYVLYEYDFELYRQVNSTMSYYSASPVNGSIEISGQFNYYDANDNLVLKISNENNELIAEYTLADYITDGTGSGFTITTDVLNAGIYTCKVMCGIKEINSTEVTIE